MWLTSLNPNSYLYSRWGFNIDTLKKVAHPVRVGDVLILPLGSLNVSPTIFGKLWNWLLGQNYTPLSTEQDRVYHGELIGPRFVERGN